MFNLCFLYKIIEHINANCLVLAKIFYLMTLCQNFYVHLLNFIPLKVLSFLYKLIFGFPLMLVTLLIFCVFVTSSLLLKLRIAILINCLQPDFAFYPRAHSYSDCYCIWFQITTCLIWKMRSARELF